MAPIYKTDCYLLHREKYNDNLKYFQLRDHSECECVEGDPFSCEMMMKRKVADVNAFRRISTMVQRNPDLAEDGNFGHIVEQMMIGQPGWDVTICQINLGQRNLFKFTIFSRYSNENMMMIKFYIKLEYLF